MKRKYLSIPLFVLMLSTVLSIPLHLMPASALPLAGPSLVVDDSINRINATLGINSGSQITAKGTIKNIGGVTLTKLLTGVFFIEGTGVLVPADFSFDYSPDGITWFPIHPSEVKVPTPAAAPMQVELVVGSPGGETLAPNATQTMYLRMTLNNNMSPIGWPTNIIQSMIVWVYGDTNFNRQYDGGEIIYSQPPAYGGLVGWDNPVKIDLAIVHTAEIAGTGKFYYSIQSAINVANLGDTIYVYPGTYNEAVNVNKAVDVISIAGYGQTIIDGTGLVLASAGLVTMSSLGNAKFQGFTVKNAPAVGVVRIGIFSQGPAGPTYTILNNKVYGTNNPSEADDYGFYAQSGAENVVFRGNTITQTGANNIVLEVHTGATEISGNTLEAGIGNAADAIFAMTYNGLDVAALQNVSYNTFNMSTGGPFDYAHRSSAISFNSPGAAWGLADAKFTNVVIQGNTITGLQNHRRGIGFWNGGGGGGGTIAPLVKGNTITGVSGSNDSYGIDFIGANSVTGAIVTYNKLSATDWAIYMRTANCAPGTKVNYNTITGNKKGLDNTVGPSDVDARFNWWGQASGPFHPVTNTGGLGNNVTDNVDYSPWLGMAVGSTPMTWHVNPTGTIQEAIDEAKSGDTILVHSGTYNEALYITKTLTIQAASAPVIQGSQLFATNYGNRQAVIFVKNAQNVILNGLDIEGLGLGIPGGTKSYAVLYENSSGLVKSCTVSPNTIGDMYSAAIAAWDHSILRLETSTVKNFGRIGIYSNNASMTIAYNTIIGQTYSQDNLVNYGIEIEDYSGPSTAVITQNIIRDCNNNNPNPMWSSAAIIVDTWREWADVYGLTLLPSKVSITYNTIYNNYESIELVANDLSYAFYNNFTNNAYGVVSAAENFTTHPTYYVFDARFNWWGDASGPHHMTSWMYKGNPYGPHLGLGDEVSDYVLYDPWTGVPTPTFSVQPDLVQKQMLNITFSVDITLNDLREGFRAVSLQFRLLYDDTLLQLVDITEGPFMQDPRWNHHGTMFFTINETTPFYGPHVLVGILLNPDENGIWDAFPSGDGTLATITFQAIVQGEPGEPPLTCGLTLADTMIVREDIEDVPTATHSGQYQMLPTHLADLNRDYKVDIKDVSIVARAFGTTQDDWTGRWNPIADINKDGKIDIKDVSFVARNFGWRALDDP